MIDEKPKGPEPIFVCLSVILLTFFLFLNSLTSPKREKTSLVLNSIAQRFHFSTPNEMRSFESHPSPQAKKQWSTLSQLAQNHFGEVEIQEDKLVILFPADLWFEDGNDIVNDKATELIHEMTKATLGENLTAEVQVHTDNFVSLSARYPSLWTLSIQRAQSIYRLMKNSGISDSNVTASGFAASHPLFSNETADNRAKNRRVIFVFSQSSNSWTSNS